MTDFFVSFLSVLLGLVFIILTWVFKSRLFSFASLLCWTIPAVYSVGRVYFSGDADFGIYTLAFGLFCLLMAILSLFVPGLFGEGMEETQPKSSLDEYTQNITKHKEQIQIRRSLGIRKPKWQR